MASIRELKARFVAQASGFKATISGMKKDLSGLAKDTKKTTQSMGRGFRGGMEAIQTNMQKASRGFKDFGDSLGHSSAKVEKLGWSLTKKLTVPAMAVTGALGLMVAKMGWDRLKSIDEAKAQLKGLGYSADEITSIMGTTEKAIEGGMTTMGEGISIAAGGLSAGVKEGKDLEKYIRLVGDSAVGAKRPVDEMAQIFNRVVGGGRLMTQELNMIEHGMPGFAKAMADSYGVSVKAFREMVTAGEVDSDRFLLVMDDFAGGMANAYSGTLSGMVQNTKAYIAILGQNLMGGVFEKSKESLAEFIELISSPEIQKKAREMGESLGKTFDKLVEGAKNLVKWYLNLDYRTQKLVFGLGAFLVALGPTLILIGKLGSGVAMLSKGIGSLIGFLAKLITPIISLTKSTGLAGKSFSLMGKTIGTTSTTFGALLGWIGLFVVAIVGAWRNSEPFRKSIKSLGDAFVNLWGAIVKMFSPLDTSNIKMADFGNVIKKVWNVISDLGDIIFKLIGGALSVFVNYITFVIDNITALLSGFEDFVKGFKNLIAGDFSGALESFKNGIVKMANNIGKVWRDMFNALWTATKNGFNNLVVPFGDGLGNLLLKIGKWGLDAGISLAKGLGNMILAVGKWALDIGIKFANGLGNMILSVGKWALDLSIEFVKGLGSTTIAVIKWTGDLIKNMATGLGKGTVAIGKKLYDWTKEFGNWTLEMLAKAWEWAKEVPSRIAQGFSDSKDDFMDWFDDKRKELGPKLIKFKDDVVKWAKALPGNIKKGLGNGKDIFKDWLEDQHDQNKEFYFGLGNKAKDWLIDKKESIGEGLSSWAKKMTDFFESMPKKIKVKASAMWETFSENFLDKWGKITENLDKWGTAIGDWFSKMPGRVSDKAKDMWVSFSNGFLDKKDAIVKKMKEWGTSIGNWFSDMPGTIKDKAGEMWKGFKSGFLDKKDAVKDGLVGWKDSIFEWFGDTKTNIKEWAGDFGTSFKDGIINAKDKVVDSFNSWYKGIKDWFKELGEKKEPKEAGKNIIKSVGDGLNDKKTQDDILSKIGNFIIMLPIYILGIGAVLMLAVGRELIKKMATGITLAGGLVQKAVEGMWKLVEKVFSWGINLVIDFFTTGFAGRLIKQVKTLATNFTNSISDMWETAKTKFSTSINNVYERVKNSFVGRIIKSVVGFVTNFKTRITDMWNSAKNTFSTFINNIYTSVKNSFIGRIITNIIGFAKNFRTRISDMWKSAKNTFTTFINSIYSSIKNSFIARIIKSIVGFAKNFRTRISDMWKSAKNTFTNFINTIYNAVRNSFVGRIISNIVGFVKNFKNNMSNMWRSVKNNFSKQINSIRKSIANSFVGRILDSARNLRRNFLNIISDMWKKTKKQFTTMVEGAKALPGRIGRGIKGMASYATNGMKYVGNKLIGWAKRPFNKVVGGINWITGKLNPKRKKIATWQPDLYAHGTKRNRGHGGGPAVLGDGVGSNAGRELTILPGGKAFMSEDSPTLYPNLPKGTEVLSATDTRDFLNGLPRYAKGTGFIDKVKSGAGKVKDKISDVWGYIKKPSKLLNLALEKFGANMSGKFGSFGQMLRGGFNKVKQSALSRVKKTFKDNEKTSNNPGYSPAGPSSPGASAWRKHIELASATMKANASTSEINGIIAQIHRESGGNQRIVQSNAVWDINTASGNPARGLLQYIPQTFNAYKTRGYGNIYSGYDQLRAFFNNSTWRRDLPYGRRGWGPRGARRGYADGGIVDQKQLAWIAEGGWAESIISHDPSKKTRQKAIWEKTGDKLGFNNESQKIAMLERLTKSLENENNLALLQRIAEGVEKGHVIEMDTEKVAKIINKPLKKMDAEFGVGRYF